MPTERPSKPQAVASAIDAFVTQAADEENQWLHQDAILSLRTVVQHLEAEAAKGKTRIALPIFTTRTILRIHLSPSYLAQPMEGVREQINRSVLRYVEQLNGVLLSYSKLRLTSPLGKISHDAPEVHVRVEFDATYFAPKVGEILEGSVSRIGSDHVALLVLGIFNAAVAHPPAPLAAPLRQDDTAKLIVRSITHAHGLLSMHGDFVQSSSNGQSAAGAVTPGAPSTTPEPHSKLDHRTKEQRREERKRRKDSTIPAAAPAPAPAPAAAPAPAPALSLPKASTGPATDAAPSTVPADEKKKRTPEERAAKKQRKAEREARKAAETAAQAAP